MKQFPIYNNPLLKTGSHLNTDVSCFNIFNSRITEQIRINELQVKRLLQQIQLVLFKYYYGGYLNKAVLAKKLTFSTLISERH